MIKSTKMGADSKGHTAPRVSVITVAYNAEEYLEAAIISILSQTFRDYEYLIIDDASTDTTPAIINRYAAQDARIKSTRNAVNLGISGARNRGLDLAKGAYVAWQDADDVSEPDRLELQYRFLRDHPNVGIVGGYLQFFSGGRLLGVRKYATHDDTLRKGIFRYSPVAQPAAMIQKQCLDEAGPFDLRWPAAEDLDMSFRIGRRYEFANIPKILLRYRQHASSTTFRKLRTIELNTLAIRRRYAGESCYRMTVGDRLYNYLQLAAVFLVPPKPKIALFNLWRNTRQGEV